MKIILSDEFCADLEEIVNFIKEKDGNARALKFSNELFENIEKIASMPFAYRKNPRYNDEKIRDMIFKGFVTTFIIENEAILMLYMYKSNLPRG